LRHYEWLRRYAPRHDEVIGRRIYIPPVVGDPAYEALIARVVGDVEALRIGLDLPRDVRCTAFEQRLWRALRRITAAETIF
jgi:hypothetical protein